MFLRLPPCPAVLGCAALSALQRQCLLGKHKAEKRQACDKCASCTWMCASPSRAATVPADSTIQRSNLNMVVWLRRSCECRPQPSDVLCAHFRLELLCIAMLTMGAHVIKATNTNERTLGTLRLLHTALKLLLSSAVSCRSRYTINPHSTPVCPCTWLEGDGEVSSHLAQRGALQPALELAPYGCCTLRWSWCRSCSLVTPRHSQQASSTRYFGTFIIEAAHTHVHQQQK
jgi:hypothetical protein